MKKIFFAIVFLLICNKLLIAQQNDTSWTRKTISDFRTIYFGISNEMGDFHKTESYFLGFDLGMHLHPFNNKNTSLKIGLGGSWLDNSVTLDFQTSNNYLSYPVNLKYGGVRSGLLFFTDKIFIPSFDILFAAGDLRYQVPVDVYSTYKNEIGSQTVPIYVIMPKINFEIKITETLKLGWGFSYRLVKGINVPWSNNDLASGFGYMGTFVGTFGQ